jgi:pyruvate/2-oxoglutarate/acetoin dehydrogenase E1 component
VAGLALAFQQERSGRVAVSFIGEGGSSLGEWHEAINLCAARKLPAVFCIQNNQTALSTPVSQQSAVRAFADKSRGYGIPGVTVDGTDPDAIAAAFAWAAERARDGLGPALIELISMRMCGHAHHDDMLYLGKEPAAGRDYPETTEQGYADRELYARWAAKDPIPAYADRLESEGELAEGDLDRIRSEAERQVREQAAAVVDAPWPEPEEAGRGVLADEPDRTRIEILENRFLPSAGSDRCDLAVDAGPAFDPKGSTFLEAVMLGLRDALEADPKVFLYGEDIGGAYGNAFLLLRPLLEKYGDRILNSTLAEGGILGVCTGAALAGQRPVGEIQFNDFIATGFNQLVNNAAMVRYRWSGSVPMVIRMPWGGLRNAGPYHSQNTEPWFYRTPGLKIVAPSTPYDARALMLAAVRDPDPVLYYEHIALYRNPGIRQRLEERPPAPMEIGRAALRRNGDDLLIVSYGAYVHHALRVATRLDEDGIGCAVLDLRSLAPLDRDLLLAAARKTGKVLIVQEDSRTGSIGESLAAVIQEEAFESLDAPVRVLGALDTPVPYSPPLEEAYLVSEAEIEKAARLLVAY